MKFIIAGGRDFDDYELMHDTIAELEYSHGFIYITEVVSGTASGADTLGERYANEKSHILSKFPADWTKYGKSAGYIRNQRMADYADGLIAFWDGESKGTKHMIDIAVKKGMWIKVVKY